MVPPRVINIDLPSVQSLLLTMRFDGQNLSTGTGFVTDSARGPLLLTNRHNVTGRHWQTNVPLSETCAEPNEIAILHNKAKDMGSWIITVEPLYDDEGGRRWIEHPILGPQADFVALPLTQLNDVEWYPYDLVGTKEKISLGPADTVSVVGFPFGLQAGGSLAVWVSGFIASEPGIDFWDLPIFLIDCRSRPGQSGSPVIAHRRSGAVQLEGGSTAMFGGTVTWFLGIYSGRINDQSDIGIVWKVQAIQELVSTIG